MFKIIYLDEHKRCLYSNKKRSYIKKILDYMGIEEIEKPEEFNSPKDNYYMAGFMILLDLLEGKPKKVVYENRVKNAVPHLVPYREKFYKELLKSDIDLTPYIQDLENYRYKLWAEGQPFDEPIKQIN